MTPHTRWHPPPTGTDPTMALLSPRQADVLACLRNRLTNRQIADRLHVTEGTVNSHIRRLRIKFDAADRYEVVANASIRTYTVRKPVVREPIAVLRAEPVQPVTVIDGFPCTHDPERMFPHANDAGGIASAKKVCDSGGRNGTACPQKDKCFDYSLRTDVQGVWAGTSEDERRALRDKLGIVPEPLAFGKGVAGWGLELHGTNARARAHYRDGEKPCGPCRDAAQRFRHPDNPSQWDGRAS